MSESKISRPRKPVTRAGGWRALWVWPWANGRRRVPLRGLGVLKGRDLAGKVWKYHATREGGGFLGRTLPGYGYEAPRS